MRSILLGALLLACSGPDDPSDGPSDPDDTGAPLAHEGTWSLLTGDSRTGWVDGVGEQARFIGVTAMCAVPGASAVVLADTFGGTLRHLDLTTGEVRRLAGNPWMPGIVDGQGDEAGFSGPRGIGCTDDAVVVADDGALRRVGLDGRVTTVAGQPNGPGYEDGPALAARFGYLIHAMTRSPDGSELLLTDRSNDALRAVDLGDWSVRTLAQGLDGPGGLTHDGTDIWVADTFAHRLVRVGADGAVHPFQTHGESLSTPQGLAYDGEHLWTGGFDGRVLRVETERGTTVRVGRIGGGWFASPVVVDDALIVFDMTESAVHAIALDDGAVQHVAGPMEPVGHVDGPLEQARFGAVGPLTASPDGRQVVVADPDNGAIRWIDRDTDEVRTWLGPGGELAGDELPQQVGGLLYDDGRVVMSDTPRGRVVALALDGGFEILAEGLSQPMGLARSDNGTIYVAAAGGRRIEALGPDGSTVVAGAGSAGSADGPALEATFRRPVDLAWLPGDAGGPGLLLVVDEAGETVRAVDLAAGEVRTVAGADGQHGWIDGADARFDGPVSITADGPEAALVVDLGNHAVRRVDLQTGEVQTVLGGPTRRGGLPPGGELPLSQAGLVWPMGIVRAQDEVFVTSEYGVYRADLDGGPW